MILLKGVSHVIGLGGKKRWLLQNQTLTIADQESVGILAPPGSGKTTLARLLSGVEKPHSGTIHSSGPISWPVGLASLIHPEISVQDNLMIVARLCGAAPKEARDDFIALCGSELLEIKMAKHLSPTERALFGYGLSLMVPMTHYIFDEKHTVGTAAQQENQRSFLETRRANSGSILISRNVRLITQNCRRFFKLIKGQILECSHSELIGNEVTHV